MIQLLKGHRPRRRRRLWPFAGIAKPLFCAAVLLFSAVGLFAQEAAASRAEQAASAPGEAARRIGIDEAVDLALKNNLSLESARVALDIKKRKSDLVWNQFLPDLAARGSLAMDNAASTVSGNVPVPLPGSPGIYGVVPYSVDAPRWHVQGNFSASLTLSAALFQGIKTIRMDYQTGRVSYEKARVQMERDVRKAYYQILLAAENVSLLKESFATAERQVAMAEANYRSGLSPQLTLLQAQVSRDNMLPTIDQAENGLKLSMANFAMTLGLPYDSRFELVPVDDTLNFVDLELSELISKAVQNKPDILELRQQLLTLKTSRQAQSLQLYTPYLNLSWNYSPTFLADPFKDEWFKSDNWSDRGTFSVTLGINLNNLFSFTKEGQGLKDVDNNIQTATIGLSQMMRGTELEVYNTVLSLEKTRITMEAQNKTVALAERSYQLTENAYRAGLNDYLQVQNAALELRRARIGVLEQQFNYLTGLIDLEYAMGVSFGTLNSGSVK
ncbi:MAG: TolC family protein [Treponema sp.]|jgi:outer membrane protein TolC|nr:TolC family protein [Treponema sp.]